MWPNMAIRAKENGRMTLDNSLTVFFDGACPLCRREIGWYRRRPGAERIEWVDVSNTTNAMAAPDLPTAVALARLHVRMSDGRVVSGARAFAELWARLPGLRFFGRVMRLRPVQPVLEIGYRVFLRVRPSLQRVAAARENSRGAPYPSWLESALRSDHAGETGAVAIYRGILSVTRDPSVRAFAERHLASEMRHLTLMEEVLPRARRSRLLALWKSAGFLTGALPSIFGANPVYATIDAVESFVDEHYAEQISNLAPYPEWHALRDLLVRCRADEIEHRDEARRSLTVEKGLIARVWVRLVALGSAGGVSVARIV